MTSVELGADPVAVRAVAGVNRLRVWTATGHVIAALGRRGVACMLACLAAVGVAAAVVAEVGAVVWVTVATVAITLGWDLVSGRRRHRTSSLRPVGVLAVTTALGSFAGTAFAWLSPADVRAIGLIALTAAFVFSAAVLLARAVAQPRVVLLVGGRAGVGQLVEQWATCRHVVVRGVCLAEFVDESAQEMDRVPILGSLDDAVAVARAINVDEVVVVPGPLLGAHQVRRLSWALEDASINLSIAAEFEGVAARRISPQVIGRRLTLGVEPGRRSRTGWWTKHTLDRMAGSFLLLVASPLLAVIAVVVKLDSPGPALFRQTRVGKDGKSFTIFKFRTMQADAEERLGDLLAHNEAAGPLFKMAADPRTTPVGRLLRRSSMDELPQLFNVIKGEMSLIGPRPSLPVEVKMYDEWIQRRLRVKPGMTGAWQVGGRSNLNWTESVRLDIDYVDNSTLRDDVKIALKTAQVVVSRDGAV